MRQDLQATRALIGEFVSNIGRAHTMRTLNGVRARLWGNGPVQPAEELPFYTQQELFDLWVQLTQAGAMEHSCRTFQDFYRRLGRELVLRSGKGNGSRRHARAILGMLADCYNEYAEMRGMNPATDTVH